MEFIKFSNAIRKQFNKMAKTEKLFVVKVDDKNELWNFYLNSFPTGTNEIYKENKEYDCNFCKSFIKKAGHIVTIKNNKLVSIFDITINDSTFQAVVDAMSEYIKGKEIDTVFCHDENTIGTEFNTQITGNGSIRWNHFYIDVPNEFIKDKNDIGTYRGDNRTTKGVLYRSLKELSLEAAQIVLELIESGSLYRGDEHKKVVKDFIKSKKTFNKIPVAKQKIYCWSLKEYGIRNTVIGSLLIDISEGKDLESSVKSFESKVAPQNYKRPTALVTKWMIENAQKKCEELGIEASLYRRCAVAEDITINNVLFADRSVQPAMGVNAFDMLKKDVGDVVTNKQLDKIEEVPIQTFIDTILPKAKSFELLLENKHENNLMNLIAPVNPDAPNILKWNNNFSWGYNGEVADSMRQRVKNAGGRVDGVFRFSHSWNELEPNQSLMDLHVFMPGNTHVPGKIHDNYGNYERVGWNHRKHNNSGGSQDVDYVDQAPPKYIPVENITFPNLGKMLDGKYICKIHNWSYRNSGGKGKAEIEFGSNIYKYVYPSTKNKEWVTVAEVTLKNGEFSIKHILPESQETKEIYGITTNKFHPVTMMMNSPNHWDGEETGNKHYFFMLKDCKTNDTIRGIYNEFIKEELNEHRKVFEMLGSKLKAEPTDNQLAGLGFSSTRRDSVVCKVKGTFNRTIKITF